MHQHLECSLSNTFLLSPKYLILQHLESTPSINTPSQFSTQVKSRTSVDASCKSHPAFPNTPIMVSFVVQLTLPPRGSRSLALSPKSFLKSHETIQSVEKNFNPCIKPDATEMATLQPHPIPGDRSLQCLLDRTGSETLTVFCPADAKLQQASDEFRESTKKEKTLSEENSFFKREVAVSGPCIMVLLGQFYSISKRFLVS